MFTPEDRDRLRATLIGVAHRDDRITGAALFGSAALDAEDRWSDIDLAVGVAADADLDEVIAGWTGLMYTKHGALHHLDIASGARVYRVFLLASTLQVDIAFAPGTAFGALSPASGCSSVRRMSRNRPGRPTQQSSSVSAGCTRCTPVRAWPAAGPGRRST